MATNIRGCWHVNEGVPPQLLFQAGVQRVTNLEAREKYGIGGPATSDMSGIVFPYFSITTGNRVTARVRRDNPEIEDGKEKRKYISAYGDRKHLYFPLGSAEKLQDADMPVVLVEAEKSSLALTAWADRTGRKLLAVAMGGCWGWRGRVGKQENANGERVDETGPITDLAVCRNRDVIVMLDSNADAKSEVRAARCALVRELERLGARVRVATVPVLQGVNGPDDLIAVSGDEAIRTVLDLAQPAKELVVSEVEAGGNSGGQAECRCRANEARARRRCGHRRLPSTHDAGKSNRRRRSRCRP